MIIKSINKNYIKHVFLEEYFNQIRKKNKISDKFLYNELSKLKNIIGAGKSGANMWLSKTNFFFIKELSNTDNKTFEKLLMKYLLYITSNNNTLLPKFFVFYKIKKKNLIIQLNLNPFKKNTWLYDLKGSHFTRTSKNHIIDKVGKDNNFGDSQIMFKNSKSIKNQIKKDTTFLADNNLMDYSLLVCIRNIKTNNTYWNKWIVNNNKPLFKGPGPSMPNNIYINFGIIDILQKYNIKKSIESYIKDIKHIGKRYESNVSAIDSKDYKIRFDNFIDKTIKNYPRKI